MDNNMDFIGIKPEIKKFITNLDEYREDIDSDKNLTNKAKEIMRQYKLVMNELNLDNINTPKDIYIECVDKFLDVLSRSTQLLKLYGTYINDKIKRIGKNSNSNINYFIGFKRLLIPIYWKIDDNMYEGNLELKEQLDSIKSIINNESRKFLFKMFHEYYKDEKFINFSDYSECIKDSVIIVYLTDYLNMDFVVDKLSMSISYAGVDGNIGLDFRGIKTIRNMFGLIDNLEFIEAILSKVSTTIFYDVKRSIAQINAVINSSNIEEREKNKCKFIYTTALIFDGAFKRAIFKAIPQNYQIDRSDEVEFETKINLPVLLSINDGEYKFILDGYEEGNDRKNILLNGKILFSITDEVEGKFTIECGADKREIRYGGTYKLTNFLEEKLREEFNNIALKDSRELKLIYVYFEKHKILENIELKFSDKYKISLEMDESEITLKKNKWIISDNSDEVESVIYKDCDKKVRMINAIVGKNGSGKTTLLDSMKYYFNNQSNQENFKRFIVIYEDGDNLMFMHNYKEGSPEVEAICNKQFRKIKLDAKAGIFANTSILSYTSFIEFSNYIGSEHDSEIEGNHRDISVNNDLKNLERIKDAKEREVIKRKLLNVDNYKKLVLLSESKYINTVLSEPIPLPYEVLLNIKIKKESDESEKNENSYLDHIKNELDEIFGEKIVEIFKEKIVEMLDNIVIADKEERPKYELICRIRTNGEEDFVQIYDFVRKEPQGYNKICTMNFIGLSSGQYARLTLFSRLFFESDHMRVKGIEQAIRISNAFAKKNSIRALKEDYIRYSKNENLMILVDEGDMFLHPEWQKGFISDIKAILNYGFKDHEVVKTIHVLVTSNSPFIMSDIPIEHTIVLGKEGVMDQTYAQNIHDILKSQFFMHSGTLGAIAEKHVRELVGLLSSVEITEEQRLYIKKSINLIGEPLIRYKLESMYQKRFNEQMSKERKIEQLEQELARLKGQEV